MSVWLALLPVAFAQDSAPGAQDYALDIERFRPCSDTFGYTVTEGAATLQNLQLGVALWGNYSEDSLVLVWDDERVLGGGSENGDGILDNRSVADLQLGMGFSKYFSFSLDLPVVLWQEGYDPSSADNPNRSSDLVSSGLTDIRLTPKLVLLDLDDFPIGVAVIGQVTVPSGYEGSFLGEGEVTGLPMAIIEAADGSIHRREYHVRGAVNLGYRARDEGQFRDLIIHNEFVYRLAAAVHPGPIAELGVDLIGSVGGPRPAHKPIEILPWLKFLPQEPVTLNVGGGFGLNPGVGAPDFRLFAGATLAPSFDPSMHDSDKDGIYNDKDQCKVDPEDKDNYQDEDGCPEADNDKDGIVDDEDRCPNDAEDDDGFKDTDGCPDLDNDKDGILDLADRCPDEAETVNEFQDDDGCPDDTPIYDSDGDGYKDDVDRCPYDAEDFDSWEDEDGCPDPDNDMDTILDAADLCDNEKEVFNTFEDEDGCPDDFNPRVYIEKNNIKIADTIHFDSGRATIKPESFDLLNEIAQLILDHPELKKIRVEGHTDSNGDDLSNLRLSQARAQSVMNYLIGASVEASRLDSAGFGEAKPLVPNDSTEGQATNRRVEFLIVDQG
jgi:outer membrane protein OmpA-like peptidoglycan-associated protein